MAFAKAEQVSDVLQDTHFTRQAVDEDIPAGTSQYTMQGSVTGVTYQFTKVGSHAVAENGGYGYYFKMDATLKGCIYNASMPADGKYINKVSARMLQGELKVYGKPWTQGSTNTYSGYADNPVGDFLGYISKDKPYLTVVGAYKALLLEPNLDNGSSCVFNDLEFTWGSEVMTQGDPEVKPAYEISNLVVLGGPYASSTASTAYLRMEFDLTYNGEGASSIRLTPEVVEGVASYGYFSEEYSFDEGGTTQHITYRRTLVGKVAPDYYEGAKLKITGDGKVLYNEPVDIANYSPKLILSSSVANSTGVVDPNDVEIPASLNVKAGPYRGTLQCCIYPDASCTSGTMLQRSDLLDTYAVGSDFLVFEFPGLKLEPNHEYGMSFWRTNASGSNVKLYDEYSNTVEFPMHYMYTFTTGAVTGISAIEQGAEGAKAAYDLQGNKVNLQQAKAGVYIVKSGKSVRKVVVK